MKRVTLFIAFMAATLLVLTTLVFPVGAGSFVQQANGTGTPGTGTQTAGVPQTGSQSGGAAFVNLQTLQGFSVEDRGGNTAGNVSDFVINLPKTRIDYIVMAGNNGRQVLVPWSSLSAINAQKRTFTFKDDASRLDNSPEFNADGVDFSDSNWDQSIVDYWRFGTGAVQNQSNPSQSGTAQPTAQQSLSSTAQPTEQARNGASNQNSSNSLRSGAVATLASTLLNAQVVDIASTSLNSNSPASSDNPSGSRAEGTSQPTPAATSIPNSGGSQSNDSTESGDALGTVASAIVTRINGDIRYLLVRPEGALAEQIREAGLNNQNPAQSSTAQPTGQATREAGSGTNGASQMGTIQPTSIPDTGSNVQDGGEEVIPVPFDIMFPSLQDGKLVLRASPLLLRAAPVVQSNLDSLGFGWDQSINLFWSSGGLQGGRFPLFGSSQLQAGSGAGVPVTGSDPSALASAAFVRLSALNQYHIQDATGNALGNVQDFVINLPKTRIDYIVMSGSDGRTVLVPWASLASIDPDRQVFFFRYPGSQLQNAPAFDVNNPNFGDPEWDNNTINYWITGRFGSGAGNSQSSNAASGNNQNQQQPSATGTPTAGNAVPNTGGSAQNNRQNAVYAALASQLVGLPVYDQTAVNSSGNPLGVRQSAGNNQALSTAAPTETLQSTPQTEPQAASGQPSTGSQSEDPQRGSGGVIGTVQGAIVTRLNGDIRYLLVSPEGVAIPNTGGNSTPTGAFQNTVQPTASPTPGSSVPSTAQPTGIPNTGRNSAQGENLVPVPFNAVLMSSGENGLVLRASRFMLQNAPSLNAAALPDVLGFGFDQGIMSFWTTGSLSDNQGGVSNGNGGTPSP